MTSEANFTKAEVMKERISINTFHEHEHKKFDYLSASMAQVGVVLVERCLGAASLGQLKQVKDGQNG